ncbi:ATP-binding cassette domain-containing protein [Lyngbya confervoides]|uniref:ABC transporter ATP-binding protein/permease n=1 Tax=Lyngbya confervoides BDU141951 TaxID=1574623 RepID=A0ABD4T3U2_9CYAN|nr:ABC transporter ATP-binding protein [Lyngbya confervoides]MCM1982902.1 ABC transporter ATP-binding protein/permease [Lyngbya confervoides BDU141951]
MSKPPTSRIAALLWRMVAYAPRLYLLDTLLWIFIAGLPAIPGLLIREFFNALTTPSSVRLSPQVLIALLLATGLARIVVIFGGRFTKTQHRFTMSALIRRNLLERLLHRPGALPLRSATGDSVSGGAILSFFREDAQQLEDNAVGTNELLGEGMFALASLALLVHINARITLLVFLPLMLIAGLIQRLTQRIKRYRRNQRQATQAVTGWLGEMFGAVQVIQVEGAEVQVIQHLQQLCDRREQAAIRDRMLTQLLESSFSNLVSLGTGGILLVSVESMQQQTLSVGDFALFVYYLAYVTYFLGFFGDFLTLTKQSEVSFERMEQLLDCTATDLVAHRPLYLPPLLGGVSPLPPVHDRPERVPLQTFSATGLTYHYPGSCSGIRNISLRIERGTLTVITGAVGSGKTTLLRSLLGLLPLEAGDLAWNDRHLNRPAQFLVPPQVAYTPQVPHLLSCSLRENLLLGQAASEADLEAAIALAALETDLAQFPLGLDMPIGVNGMRLSGGQVQRAAAARMLIRQSELLVFDDLSSALDLDTEQRLWSRLFNAQGEQTYLVVSHRPQIWQRADQILVLDQGQIAFLGPLQALPESHREFLEARHPAP